MTDRTHWLESGVSLWQLIGSILTLALAAGSTYVIQGRAQEDKDRAAENRLTKLEVRQDFNLLRGQQQDVIIEFLRTTAEQNRIALGEIKQRLEGQALLLREIQIGIDARLVAERGARK